MKKFFYLASCIVLMASCSNPTKENGAVNDSTKVDDKSAVSDTSTSVTVSDTMNVVSAKDKATADSINQSQNNSEKESQKTADEKSKPSRNAKKIDKDLKWFEHDVKQYKEAVRCGMIGSELWELEEPCLLNEKNLKKYEDEMTPEQKAKFKKYQKMLNK